MPFDFHPEIGPAPRKTWSIVLSLFLHVLVLLLLTAGWMYFDWQEAIRLAGKDYEKPVDTVMLAPPVAVPPEALPPPPPVERIEALPPETTPPEPAPLTLPPSLLPPTPPLPAVPPPPMPPAPPTPPPPAPPPAVIHPEDVIADGARPDGTPRASRGNTPDPLRNGSLDPPRMLSPAPIVPVVPVAPPGPATPPVTSQTPRLPMPQTPPAVAESRPPAPMPGLPETNRSNPVDKPQIPQPPQGGLLMDGLSSGRAGNAITNAQQGVTNQMARQPQPGNKPSEGSIGRTGIDRGVELPNFNTDEPQILSDTRGYDFGPYLNQVVNKVRKEWYYIIPESVKYSGQKGTVMLTFVITKSGRVQDLTLRSTSGQEPLDRAAMGSITGSNPFPSLPTGFTGDHLTLQFTYFYNVRP